MRVISGTARGAKLRTAKGLDTRPTADRIKESIFNMLAPDLYGCKFLDLFSGSGAMGIEALSRGAQLAVLVDDSPTAARVINENLNSVRLNARVLCMDFEQALSRLSGEGVKFDIIFMDPPYGKGLVERTLAAVERHGVLNTGGYIAVELENGVKPQTDLTVYKSKRYGRTSVIFLR